MVLTICLLGLLGAAMGSFVGALVWRLHTGRDFVKERSECEHCHHKLSFMDLIPVVSWILLQGKCRYCRKPIGKQALVLEVALAALFVLSYLFWPLGFNNWMAIASFIIWLVYIIFLAALFLYDLRWQLLLDKLVYPLIVIGVLDAVLRTTLSGEPYVTHALLGAGVLGGLYGVLYGISKGKWVGFGDVKLGIFMGIALGWKLALLVLIIANIAGFLVVIPGLLSGKLTRKSRVPFGPFLIIGFIVAGLFGEAILRWYLQGLYF